MTKDNSDQLKARAAQRSQARRGLTDTRRIGLLRIALLGLLGWNSLQAGVLTQFSIRSTDNPLADGGFFADGATFSGTFVVDLSQTFQPYLLLTGWDMWTSDSQLMDPDPVTHDRPLIPGQHYSSDAEGATAWLAPLDPITNWFDFDQVGFFQGDSALFLQLVEPVGGFKGGLVLHAEESYNTPFPDRNMRDRQDWTGSAILIDPAIVDATNAPEPGTGTLMIAALLFLASISVVRHHGKIPCLSLVLTFGITVTYSGQAAGARRLKAILARSA
jgi:hypothetical protein